jgi:hypothetical protein
VGPRRSTGGSTSSSTGIRPIMATCGTNCGVSVGIPRTGRTITSSTSRRIPMDTAGLEGVECPSKSRSYRWGRRRKSWFAEGSLMEPEGYELAASIIRIFSQECASSFRR